MRVRVTDAAPTGCRSSEPSSETLVASVQVGELPSIGALKITAYKACTVTQEERAESLQGGSRGFEPLEPLPRPESSFVGTGSGYEREHL
jgi:hypothetical protein